MKFCTSCSSYVARLSLVYACRGRGPETPATFPHTYARTHLHQLLGREHCPCAPLHTSKVLLECHYLQFLVHLLQLCLVASSQQTQLLQAQQSLQESLTGITHYAQTDRQTQHTFCLARPCSSCVRAPKALAASTNSPQWTEWIHCRLGRAWSARNCCSRGRCSSGWENSIEYWPADTTPTANHNASHNTCTKSHTANPPHTTQGHPPNT